MSPAIKPQQRGWRAAGRRFRKDRRGGVSAVEFTLLVPALATAFMASLEVANLIWTDTAASESASAIADLASRFVAVDDTTVLSSFQAAERMINPEARSVDGLTMRLSSVIACEDPVGSGNYTFRVIWSHGYSEGRLSAGRPIDQVVTDIPQAMGPPSGGTLLFGETTYRYVLPFGFVLGSAANTLSSDAYFRPRLSRSVAHTGSQQTNQAPSCP